jgi:Eukaryotic initiation factor 4E
MEISNEDELNLESVKLKGCWSLHYGAPNRSQSWELKKVFELDNVGDLLTLLNSIKQPSNLTGSAELSFFRQGVIPDWEDEPCKSGGRWTVKLDKLNDASLDLIWFQLISSVLGRCFNEEDGVDDIILGVAYSGKQQSRKLAIWTRNSEASQLLSIGNSFRTVLADVLGEKDLGDVVFEDFKAGRHDKNKYPYIIQGKKVLKRF